MTWTELAEEQIDRMRMMPDSSQEICYGSRFAHSDARLTDQKRRT